MTSAPIGCAEFQLLLDCCSSNFGTHGASEPRISQGTDWSRLLDLARFHRVQGLVWNALAKCPASLPAGIAEQLSNDARSIAAMNLAIAQECGELNRSFAQSRVPLMFVKGLTLSALVYRSPMLKMGWDVDLLIDPADLDPAAHLLRERGYSLLMPTIPADLPSWHSRRKESVWSHPKGLYIELHTRLADNSRLIRGLCVHSPSQQVEIAPGVHLPTLGRDELFTYLCVHGASSAWFRLKWIADFAAFVSRYDGAMIAHLYSRSQDLGAYRSAAQALLLADMLYSSLEATDLKPALLEDRASRWLAAAALHQVAGHRVPQEPTSRPLGTARIHWTQFLLKPGLGFKLSELSRQLIDAIA